MRTNFAGFFLAAGMGLIVILLGVGALSMAGLVSIMPVTEEAAAPADTTALPQAWCGNAYASASAISTYVPASSQEVLGDALFKANCVQCHAISEKVVGPALGGITKRRNISWLVLWIRNSSKVIASGDEYAIKLFNDNGKQQMPSFQGLSEKEIISIIRYVEAVEGQRTVTYYAPVAID